MRTEFICNRCGVESHVDIDSKETVYEGCAKITREHEKWSPECMGDLSTIRLLPMVQPEQVKASETATEGQESVSEAEETDEEYEERTRPRIVNAPDRIWLQAGCDDEVGQIEWSELAKNEVTWCWERIDNTDIEYVRADRVEALTKALRQMRCTCSQAERYGHYDGPHCDATIARAALAQVEQEGQS